MLREREKTIIEREGERKENSPQRETEKREMNLFSFSFFLSVFRATIVDLIFSSHIYIYIPPSNTTKKKLFIVLFSYNKFNYKNNLIWYKNNLVILKENISVFFTIYLFVSYLCLFCKSFMDLITSNILHQKKKLVILG